MLLIGWCPLLLLVPAVLGDLFTSVHSMKELARREDRLMASLQRYIYTQQTKLSLLKQKYERLSRLRLVGEDLEDPVTAFVLVRRLVREWPLLLNLIMESVDFSEELLDLPSESDMQSALRGLTRLQKVYNLDTELLAEDKGDLGVMTASDCYEMGKNWYKEVEFDLAISWFNQAQEKIARGDSTVGKDQVLAHWFLASAFNGCRTSHSTMNTNDILQYLVAEHPNFALNKELTAHYKQALARNCSWVFDTETYLVNVDAMSEEHNYIYNRMCQGQSRARNDLKCYYVNYDNPRLLVAPFKLEELHLEPPLLMFHDVISENEIEEMKTSFLSVMTSCETIQGNQSARSLYRTCNVGWIDDNKSATSERLTRRMGDITNLAMETSEQNQVASYGLGGEFMLHRDPLVNASLSARNSQGNRIATLMFYLNDVASGGRTVFPLINTAVTPRKGSAVFWYNIDSRGEELGKMLHGGCPVLRGAKWVINKWIHEGGQSYQLSCPHDGIFPRKHMYL